MVVGTLTVVEVSLVRDEHLHGQGVRVAAEALVLAVLRVGAGRGAALAPTLSLGGAAHAEQSVFGDALALLEVVADDAEGAASAPLGVVLVGHHGRCGRMALAD